MNCTKKQQNKKFIDKKKHTFLKKCNSAYLFKNNEFHLRAVHHKLYNLTHFSALNHLKSNKTIT